MGDGNGRCLILGGGLGGGDGWWWIPMCHIFIFACNIGRPSLFVILIVVRKVNEAESPVCVTIIFSSFIQLANRLAAKAENIIQRE